MDVRETFIRGKVLGTEPRRLPAEIYNLSHILLVKSGRDSLFVPIRSMQYLAVIDSEEIIFVDSMNKRVVQLSWKAFTPQVRESLTEAVPYTVYYYHPDAHQTMQRLQGEFSKALQLVANKMPSNSSAKDDKKVITYFDKDKDH